MAQDSETQFGDTVAVERNAIDAMSFTRPYWEATRDRRLLIQFCPQAQRYQFYPRPASIFTGRRDLEWREVEGLGEVFTYTITRRSLPPFRGHEPFIVALVELDEGVRIMANLVHVAEGDLRIGLKVKPFWIAMPDGHHQLAFEPR